MTYEIQQYEGTIDINSTNINIVHIELTLAMLDTRAYTSCTNVRANEHRSVANLNQGWACDRPLLCLLLYLVSFVVVQAENRGRFVAAVKHKHGARQAGGTAKDALAQESFMRYHEVHYRYYVTEMLPVVGCTYDTIYSSSSSTSHRNRTSTLPSTVNNTEWARIALTLLLSSTTSYALQNHRTRPSSKSSA